MGSQYGNSNLISHWSTYNANADQPAITKQHVLSITIITAAADTTHRHTSDHQSCDLEAHLKSLPNTSAHTNCSHIVSLLYSEKKNHCKIYGSYGFLSSFIYLQGNICDKASQNHKIQTQGLIFCGVYSYMQKGHFNLKGVCLFIAHGVQR